MIVTPANYSQVFDRLKQCSLLSLDTETTGLRPYHGDHLFALTIAIRGAVFYFNFQVAGPEETWLNIPGHLSMLSVLFEDPSKTWYLHNAKYDMHMLARQGLYLRGTVHCTKAIARVEYNEHAAYDLASCAARMGFAKDDAVEAYIDEHHLWDWETVPGRKQRKKNKHFDAVPFSLIVPYAERDAEITFALGSGQTETLTDLAGKTPPGLPTVTRIVDMERRLTKVVFEMEHRGVLIDRPYCERAKDYELGRASAALQEFKRHTGRNFSASPLLFKDIFASERDKWVFGEPTKTGQINPSFDSEVLASFENPAAKEILRYRDAKSKSDFYSGFLYHADSHGILHPNFNPDGTRTGRFSSSDPNLQNLTDEEGLEDQEFIVRRAIIPRPGYVFLMPDFDQMEYRMMLDYAKEMGLIEKVKGGLDVHEATAQLMSRTRKEAKTLNFMLLYGGGVQKLADALGIDASSARALKARYFEALPNVQKFIEEVQATVCQRGFLRNWAGRRSYFPNAEFAYTGPNTLIQGGCADVNKFALVGLADALRGKDAHVVLTIHDENPIEAKEDQAEEVARIAIEVMENIYPGKHLRLTVGMEWSPRSLGDKLKGMPGGTKARDGFPGGASHSLSENPAKHSLFSHPAALH